MNKGQSEKSDWPFPFLEDANRSAGVERALLPAAFDLVRGGIEEHGCSQPIQL
jgi:hypothetical protein